MKRKPPKSWPVNNPFKVVALFCVLVVCSASMASGFLVTKIYDGDTIRVESGGRVIYVMLLGIDAPEVAASPGQPSQPYGITAKKTLSELILNREVQIIGYGRAPSPDDKIIGVVICNGKNINLEMVKRGLAEVYEENLPQGFDIAPFVQAQKEAKGQGRGMWAQGSDYISPRQWRQSHKRSQQGASLH